MLFINVLLVKGIYAYFIHYTNEIINNFTILAERQVTYNYHLLDDNSDIQESQTENVGIGSTITLDNTKILDDANYTFVNFEIDGTEYELNDEYTMPQQDIEIDEYYVRNYSITYNLNGGENNVNNPNTYTMLDTVNLQPAAKAGYTFDGWYENGDFTGNATETITNRQGNITLYAKFTVSPAIYRIEYYIEDLEKNANNETTYSLGQYEEKNSTVFASVTAEEKQIDGCTFDSTNVNNVMSGTVPVEGTLILKLYYTRNSYTLTLRKNNNVEKVSINSGELSTEAQGTFKYGEEITLKAKVGSTPGYTHLISEWECEDATPTDDETNSTAILKIAKVNMPACNTEITAIGEIVLNVYNIVYELDGGTNYDGNPISYTVENDDITIYEPTKEGYEFLGWTGTDLQNETQTVTIEQGSLGDRRYTANWQIINYNITYDLDGGSLAEGVTNPSTYTVLTNTFTLNNPTRNGYTFKGWTGSNGRTKQLNVTIEQGSTGDKSYTANWEMNGYKVFVHYYEEGATDEQGNPVKIADDEVLVSANIGDTYTSHDLLEVTDDPEILAKYELYSEPVNKTGVFTQDPIEIAYYYKVKTFDITGIAEIGGTISNIDEEVRYGENSTKDIIITPEIGKKVKKITVNGVEIGDYTENKTTKVVNVNKFTNVKEDKELVVEFKQIVNVAKIIEVPEGYETLLNTEYEYLEDAFNILPENTAGFTIQIINQIDNETCVFEDRIATLDLNGYTVRSLSSVNPGITVESGSLTVIDSGEEGIIYNQFGIGIKVETNGTLTLGVNEANISEPELKPVVEGATKGIVNRGTFNYYDGTIRGKLASLDGQTTATPTVYKANTKRLQDGTNRFETTLKIPSGAVAFIGKTPYTTLQRAIDAANNAANGGKGTSEDEIEIDLVKDIGSDSEDDSYNMIYTVDNTKYIKLDLNGHTITTGVRNYVIQNEGKLEIIDSTYQAAYETTNELEETITVPAVEGTGKIFSTTGDTILNKSSGELVISGGTISNQARYCCSIRSSGNSKITVKGGIINNTEHGIIGEGNSEITVLDGANITSTSETVSCKDGTKLTISGGDIYCSTNSSRAYAITTNSYGNILITGGRITTAGALCMALGTGNYAATVNVTINGGTFESPSEDIIDANSTYGNIIITINDCNITSKRCAITNFAKTTTYINGGTFNINGGQLFYNNTNNTMNITNGTFTFNNANLGTNLGTLNISNLTFNVNGGLTNTKTNWDNTGNAILENVIINASARAIYSGGGTLTLKNTELTSTGNNAIYIDSGGNVAVEKAEITSSSVAIDNRGILQLGADDGVIKNNDIIIKSTANEGVNNIGTFKYYEGTIKGINTKGAFIGIVSEIPSGKNIVLSEENNLQVSQIGVDDGIAQVGDDPSNVYPTLQLAVNACQDGVASNIKILKDFYITGSDTTTIGANKQITIDLDGHTISEICSGDTIINNGTITLTDNNATKGKIQTYGLYTINNTGTMTLANNITYQMLASNDKAIIKNSGNLTVSNANLYGTYLGDVCGIENNGTGNVTIDNATINISNSWSGSTTGIENNSTNNIIINNINISYVRNGAIYNSNSGTVTINGGTYTNSNNPAVKNESNGTINISGGTINGDVNNTSSGSIIMTGGTVNGGIGNSGNSAYAKISGTTDTTKIYGGISNSANATAEVTGGYIYGGNVGINNYGTLTIGTKNTTNDTSNPDIRSPYIKGRYWGLYINSGTVNFYDGKIDGLTNQAIYGTITNIEDEYEILTYSAGDTFDGGTVESGREIKVLGLEDVAEIVSTGVKYGSLKRAVEAVSTSQQDTIRMIKSISILGSASSIVIPSNKDIILDLNGNNISAGNVNTITNNGILEITDNYNGTKGKITNSANVAIKNNAGADLTLGTITIEETAEGTGSQNVEIIKNEGALSIIEATITSNRNYTTGIHCTGSGSITITKGTINLRTGEWDKNIYGIINEGTGNITFNASQLSDITFGAKAAIDNQGTGNIIINNGQINGLDYSINNAGAGNITINNGSLNKKINNNGAGSVTVNGGSIIDINNYGSGTITVEDATSVGTITNSDGGTVNFKGGSATAIDTSNSTTGTIKVSGGTISGNNTGITLKGTSKLEMTEGTVTGTYRAVLIESANATAEITGGTLIGNNWAYADDDAAITNFGTLTLGTQEGNLNQISPSITGAIYGIINSGTFKFYGGIIQSTSNEVIYGHVNEIKNNTILDISTNNGNEIAKLINAVDIAEVNGTIYSDIQLAIATCQDNMETTINILNDFSIIVGNEMTIPSTKDIILNLNGKTIIGYTNANILVNNGNLKITDTTGGKIESRAGDIITNNGNLELAGGTLYQDFGGSGGTYKYGVINKGTISLIGGQITTSSRSNITGITNKESGSLVVDSGNVNITSGYGIENTENGTVKVQGGTLYAGRYAIYDRSSRAVAENVVTTEVLGGTITGGYRGINLEQNANLKVKNTANISIIYSDSYSAKTLIEGGTITYIGNNRGNITITGGSIENTGGIAIDNIGTLTITGGTIQSTPNNAILNRGTAVIKDAVQIISTNGTAIYNNGGTLTLGEFTGANNEPAPSQVNPSVSGGVYGVQNTGTFNFYDGVITGGTLAISGTITATPTNYTIRYENDNKKATLRLVGSVHTVVSYQGQTYESIYDPIDLICNNSKTGEIIITDDITLQSQITIPSDVNITFVMQGHTISYDNAQAAIVNNGTMTVYDYLDEDEPDVIDPNEVSTIINTSGPAIQNNGTLTLGKSSAPNNTYSPMIIGVSNAITGIAPTIYDGGVQNN